MTDRSDPQRVGRGGTPRRQRAALTPLRVVVLLLIVLAGYWLNRDRDPPTDRVAPAAPASAPAVEPSATAKPTRSQISNVTIRDLDGEVVFRGTVDVQATLDRIAAGRRLEHRNDGSTFQNRERRLPRKPANYYKEYVHPTRGLSGPGPQRIVVGAGGETYYTPDHYRTFERLK